MNALFGGARIQLAQTAKAVTPFGGLAIFAEFLGRIGWPQILAEHFPFEYRSPNGILPTHTLTVFLMAVLTGARRFAHAGLLRADRALQAMLGVRRCPGDDAIRNLFRRFSAGDIQRLFRPLWRWMLTRHPTGPEGYTLDIDSTVLARYGHQEGARRGYNPGRHGGRSHHPLVAVLAESQFVLHAWLRAGDTTANSNVLSFLNEAFGLAEQCGVSIQRLRADCGYYGQELLGWLEERAVGYLIIARQTTPVLRAISGIRHWQALSNGDEVGEFTAKVGNWKQPRRFAVLRRRERDERPEAWLLRQPGYTYRVLVTNRSESPAQLWQQYDGRAQVELRLRELKEDLNVDGFALQSFFASEAAFLSVICLYNLLGEFQRVTAANQPRKHPATLRSETFVCGAILGRKGHHPVLHFSLAWGGLEQRIPLLDALLHWPPATSPFLRTKTSASASPAPT
jgi:Transposase DDE domain group 1